MVSVCLIRGPRRAAVRPARLTASARRGTRLRSVLHYFFTGLLVAMSVLIAWFSGYVVYKLYEGQR
ncbi:hypothetical protein [Frankia gtarii]|uniref:hypothetical protein n=1 Tax=Frankia gtarii TaxID=2950102 RepID=UPI0021C15963|nr:hypothetical protein [Frankia gtarii]